MDLLFLFLILNVVFLFFSLDRLARIKLAKATLENIDNMYRQGLISEIQAKVYLNEMVNPFDTRSILEVDRELKEIYEKHQNSNR